MICNIHFILTVIYKYFGIRQKYLGLLIGQELTCSHDVGIVMRKLELSLLFSFKDRETNFEKTKDLETQADGGRIHGLLQPETFFENKLGDLSPVEYWEQNRRST